MLPPFKLFVYDQDRAEAVWKHDLAHGARITDIVSVRGPREPVPEGLDDHPARQLRLMIRDIPYSFTAEENLGRAARACSYDQVRKVVRFGRALRRDSVVLVHCAAGASRSPAVALTLLATALGKDREEDAVEHLVAVHRFCSPNPRIVYLADKVLRRDGCLFEAFRSHFWTGPHPYDEWYPPEKLGAP